MSLANIRTPTPVNEPIRQYAPHSEERRQLKAELDRQRSRPIEIPIIIDGREIRTGATREIICPHHHRSQLGFYHLGNDALARQAIQAALQAKENWERMPWEERAAIFLKAAELLSTRYRYVLNAATILGQSKNVYQAELDAACELVDYLRFNVSFMNKIYDDQIHRDSDHVWTRMEYRPLEGIVFAVTPFNFTAISGNLPSAPAMMGNVVVWKPASTALLSAYYTMMIFKEAGLPAGVINFLPGSGREIGPLVFDNKDFGGLHFTGSTETFNEIWKRIGENIVRRIYRSYPRLVGETGGKGFVVAYPDADIEALTVALFRGAFEYQGQKCSAASRAYIPRSLWGEVRKRLAGMADEVQVGDAGDFRTFMGAVIDKNSYDNIVGYIEHARNSEDADVVIGGQHDESVGYFIRPTVIEARNPKYRSMEEEIFGPVLTVYAYDDDRFEETLRLVDETSPYALTGAIFANDRFVIQKAVQRLMQSAGNLSINDKPSGAIAGQQPFGGARMSGTNDKAGSHINLLRWVSPRTIKENFAPPQDYKYLHMQD